jgi:hypothetical protein
MSTKNTSPRIGVAHRSLSIPSGLETAPTPLRSTGCGSTAPASVSSPVQTASAHATGRQRGDGSQPSGNNKRTNPTSAKGTTHVALLSQAIHTPATSEPGAVINARTAYCDTPSRTAAHRASARNHQPIPMPRRRAATTAPTVANPGTITSSGPIASGP